MNECTIQQINQQFQLGINQLNQKIANILKNRKHTLPSKNANGVEYAEGDMVLININPEGCATREEAFIQKECNGSVQLRFTPPGHDVKTRWFNSDVICGNLGAPTPEQCETLEITPNMLPELPKPLTTGTFIWENDGELHLVEIEKYNNQYFFRFADNSKAICVDEGDLISLREFSNPNDGKYLLDPGAYLTPNNNVWEILPVDGQCYARQVGKSILFPLTPPQASILRRLETDNVQPEFYISIDHNQMDKIEGTESLEEFTNTNPEDTTGSDEHRWNPDDNPTAPCDSQRSKVEEFANSDD